MNIQYIVFCITFALYIVFFTKNTENKIVSGLFLIELLFVYNKSDDINFLIIVGVSNAIVLYIVKSFFSKEDMN